MMRIKQISVAVSLRYMEGRLRKKYQLEKYDDRTKPAIFFGCYSPSMLKRAFKHKSLAVILWGGTDAKFLSLHAQGKLNHKGLNECFSHLPGQKHVRHIAISEFIADDLREVGLEYQFVPVSTVLPERFRPCPLGNDLYTYGCKRRPHVYNGKLAEEVLSRLGSINCIHGEVGTDREIPYKDMPDVYRKCFLGLRLTEHDGLPNTVIELGLMGIRCIYNGNLPNAIKWTGVDDIVENIRREQNRIGRINGVVAREMMEYISITNDWLFTSSY